MRTFLGVPIVIRGEAWGNLYLTEKAGGERSRRRRGGGRRPRRLGGDRDRERPPVPRGRQPAATSSSGPCAACEATAAIARAVGGETDLARVLELVVKRGRALVDAHDVLILLREGDELVVAAGAGHVSVADGRGCRWPARRRARCSRRGARDASPTRSASCADPARRWASSARDRAAGPARLPRQCARGARRLRPPRRRRRLHARGRAAAGGVRRQRRDGGGHRQDGRGRPPAPALAAAEAERRRWARELHDETLQALGGLRVLLSGATPARRRRRHARRHARGDRAARPATSRRCAR